jgi:hypothetical protein
VRCGPCKRAFDAGIKREWRLNNPEASRTATERYRKHNPDTARALHLRKTFGITLGRYHGMLADQGGRCAICGGSEPGGRGSFHVDHDHATGAIRGLLCLRCNAMLGHARDDEAVLERAIEYVRTHKARRAA